MQDQAVVAALRPRVVVVAARELDAVQDNAARHDLIGQRGPTRLNRLTEATSTPSTAIRVWTTSDKCSTAPNSIRSGAKNPA